MPNLTQDQRLIQSTLRNFAQTELAPFANEWDKDAVFPRAALNQLGELGVYGMLVPEEWGGAGADAVSFVLALEEIAAGDGACSTIISVNNSVVCGPILQYGSEAQKRDILAPLAQGKMLGCFCLTEPAAGSDASALTTRAVKTEDGYVLNGTKQFITSGKNADVAIVIAVTDSSAGKRGLSAFIVPTNTKGYVVASIEKKLGQRASDTAQIIFDDCTIPESHLLGKLGEGYKIALSNLESGRIGIAAQSVGMARSAYEIAAQYATERKTFNKPIIEHQAVGFRLADMLTQLTAARQMVLNAAQHKDAGLPCLQVASMAKLFASEAAEKICSDAIQVLGGYGYINDYQLERIYRDVRITQIYEGTSDIQKLVIVREIAATYS